MSFILDALRKSESERQTDAIPHITRTPLAVYKNRLPGWALGVITVLCLMLIAVVLVWWNTRRTEPDMAVRTGTPSADARATDYDASAVNPDTSAYGSKAQDSQESALPGNSSAPSVPESTSAEEESIPSYAMLVSQGIATPGLQLQLHVMSDNPERRMVQINGKIYREGDMLDAGPRITEIRPDGVVLSQSGRRFMIAR